MSLTFWLRKERVCGLGWKFYGRHHDLIDTEYQCHKWPRICSICRNRNPVLSTFMTYHRVCKKSNTTGATYGAGTVNPSWATEFNPGVSGFRVLQSFWSLSLSFDLRFLIISLWYPQTFLMHKNEQVDILQVDILHNCFSFFWRSKGVSNSFLVSKLQLSLYEQFTFQRDDADDVRFVLCWLFIVLAY